MQDREDDGDQSKEGLKLVGTSIANAKLVDYVLKR